MAGTRTMGTTLTMKKTGDEPDDTVIAHLTSIGEVNGEREEIDVTTLDSPNGAKEFIAGVVDFGSFDIAGNIVDGVQVSALYAVFNGQQNRNFEIETPSGTKLALSGYFSAFGYGVITDYDVDALFKVVYENAAKDAKGIGNIRTRINANAEANQIIRRNILVMNNMFGEDLNKKKEFIGACRSYVRLYDFLSLITGQIDDELFKKYIFLSTFLTNVDFGTTNGIDITKKVNMVEFKNLYAQKHDSGPHASKPFVNLPNAEVRLTKDEEQLLSRIIDDINAASGQTFDTDVATKAMLQIKDLLLKNENLKVGAKNNNEDDFAFSFYDDADEALLEGLMSNNEFFTLLLNDQNLKKRVLDAFKHSVYTELKKD